MPKHHFVPQFYLKGFVDPASEGRGSPYLWVVDLQSQTLKRRAPQNVASITGFYDWAKLGNEAPSIEALYSQIEGKAALVIGTLRNHKFELSLQERYDLSSFLGFQLTRVPGFRRAAVDGFGKHAQGRLQALVQDEEWLHAKLGDHNREKGDSTLTVEGVKEFVMGKRYTLTPDSDHMLGVALEAGLEFARVAFAMNWSFVIAAKGASFFTSDQPVALLTPDAKPRKIDFGSGRNPELEMSSPFPLYALFCFTRRKCRRTSYLLTKNRLGKSTEEYSLLWIDTFSAQTSNLGNGRQDKEYRLFILSFLAA